MSPAARHGARGRKARGLWLLVAAACLSLGATVLVVPPAQADPVTVRNGAQFTDPNGEPIHAHGGGVIEVDGYYYWFGENRAADDSFRYVSVYRSTDLKHWEFRDHVLSASSAPELASANIERPKVI
ncbi:hypothetical protein SAMN04487904_101439 [Actinopolyspora lacussalsi subsp. righensis]|uniref:Glycosyl hydrolases family 43 n=1 Tax=Actinopolyspora righensis TaxID=995060 RepID=A0A1I6XBI4_9ACTN|nr:hypothetical protein [Actinopolyspora righensis]SFT35685.1 hypothetical protein SAMN04487904_101439 [Actinopolyspora righensis]